MASEQLSSYDKQIRHLGPKLFPEDTNSNFLETNKYYLIFLHPDSETTNKNVFIPALSINQAPMRQASPVTLPFWGETSYYAPSATAYNPLEATLVDTDDLATRKYLQSVLLSFAKPSDKTCLFTVALVIYDRDNTYMKTVEMKNAFLSSISPISLSWQTPNQIGYYNITVNYSHAVDTENQYGFDDVVDYYTAISELYSS